MTSTSFNIGLSETRNSSKVLKPPGGGHSDIFGINSNTNEIVTPSKRRNQPPSTIMNCFKHEEEILKPAKTTTEDQPDKIDNKNEDNNGNENESVIETDENVEPKKDETKSEGQQTPARRVRVPPGGFSSGLW